jgi:hypothetical protein
VPHVLLPNRPLHGLDSRDARRTSRRYTAAVLSWQALLLA